MGYDIQGLGLGFGLGFGFEGFRYYYDSHYSGPQPEVHVAAGKGSAHGPRRSPPPPFYAKDAFRVWVQRLTVITSLWFGF